MEEIWFVRAQEEFYDIFGFHLDTVWGIQIHLDVRGFGVLISFDEYGEVIQDKCLFFDKEFTKNNCLEIAEMCDVKTNTFTSFTLFVTQLPYQRLDVVCEL